MSWVDLPSYFAGFVSPFLALGLVAAHVGLHETGRGRACDRHGWSSGPTSTTPRWRMLARSWWHRTRWHALPGQQPFQATDAWIVENYDYLVLRNRGARGRRRCQRGLRLAQRALAE